MIAFGRVRILENEREKRAALEKLALKYAPDSTQEERHGEIQREWPHVCVLEMKIEHMTGKEAIELVRARA